jgi:hypothetical protein
MYLEDKLLEKAVGDKKYSFLFFRAIPRLALDAPSHVPNYPALSMCMPLTIRV